MIDKKHDFVQFLPGTKFAALPVKIVPVWGKISKTRAKPSAFC